jgi:5-methylcytosine-specific restriction endonuclease McrA
MIRRQVVEVIKYSDKVITTCKEKIQIPLIVRLITVVRKVFKNKIQFTKKNLFVRDQYMCAYCAQKFESKQLSVDHILPESRGGPTSWENCVTACVKCNNKKDNKTPREAGMFLKFKPFEPTIAEFVKLKVTQDGLEKFVKEIFDQLMDECK